MRKATLVGLFITLLGTYLCLGNDISQQVESRLKEYQTRKPSVNAVKSKPAEKHDLKQKKEKDTLTLEGKVIILDPGHDHSEKGSWNTKSGETLGALMFADALRPYLESKGAKVYVTMNREGYENIFKEFEQKNRAFICDAYCNPQDILKQLGEKDKNPKKNWKKTRKKNIRYPSAYDHITGRHLVNNLHEPPSYFHMLRARAMWAGMIPSGVKADAFISLHYNAPGRQTGFCIYTKATTPVEAGGFPFAEESNKMAEETVKALKEGGYKPASREGHDGINHKKLVITEIGSTNCATMLIELGYITNPLEKRDALDTKKVQKKAKTVGKGVERYVGLRAENR